MNAAAAADTLALVTVTAPGASVLPCAHETCGHKGPHRQRSQDGCRVDARSAVAWNRSAARRWRELNRRAQQNVRRRFELPSPLVAYVWQMQERGVLHLHLLLAFDTGSQTVATKAYVAELRRLAPELGFGFVDFRDRAGKAGKASVMEAAKAAGYVSRYLGESAQFTRAVAATQRPRRLVYVAARVTRGTSCTMRRLRRSRHLWAARAGLCPRPVWAADVVELIRVGLLLQTLEPARAP